MESRMAITPWKEMMAPEKVKGLAASCPKVYAQLNIPAMMGCASGTAVPLELSQKQ